VLNSTAAHAMRCRQPDAAAAAVSTLLNWQHMRSVAGSNANVAKGPSIQASTACRWSLRFIRQQRSHPGHL